MLEAGQRVNQAAEFPVHKDKLRLMAATVESGTVLRDRKSDESEIDNSFADLVSSLQSRGLVSLTDREESILGLHDQLSDLRLEYALLEAQQKLAQGLERMSTI